MTMTSVRSIQFHVFQYQNMSNLQFKVFSTTAALLLFTIGDLNALSSANPAINIDENQGAFVLSNKIALQEDSLNVLSGTILAVTPTQSASIQVSKSGTPIQLVIAQSVKDSSGKILIYAGTPVIGQIQRKKGGAIISIEQMVVDNRVVPLRATSLQPLVISKVSASRDSQSNTKVSDELVKTGSNLVQSVIPSGGRRNSSLLRPATAVIGSLLGGGSKKIRVVELVAGTPLLLSVGENATVTRPSTPPAEPPSISSEPPSTKSSEAPLARLAFTTPFPLPPNEGGSATIYGKGEAEKFSLKYSVSRITKIRGHRARHKNIVLKHSKKFAIRPSIIPFSEYLIDDYLKGFHRFLELSENASKENLRGVSKRIHHNPKAFFLSRPEFFMVIDDKGVARLKIRQLDGPEFAGFEAYEIRAFLELLGRLPEATEEIIKNRNALS